MAKYGRRRRLFGFNEVSNRLDSDVVAHISRVRSDGGIIESPSDLNDAVISLKNIYSVSDLSTVLAACIDPKIFGYKIGTGAGTTLGRAANKTYSFLGASGDVVQSTLANQPLLLRHEGDNYFVTGETSSDIITTPNSVKINNCVDDYTVEIVINPELTSSENIFQNGNAPGKSIGVTISSKVIRVSQRQSTVQQDLIFSAFTVVGKVYLRIVRDSSSGDVQLFESSDGVSYSLVDTQTGYTGSLDTPSALIYCGLSASSSCAKIYEITLFDDTNAVTAYRMDADEYDVSVSQNTWVDSITGDTLTIGRSTATTGYKAQIVYRTTMQYEAVDNMVTAGNSQPTDSDYTDYGFIHFFSWSLSSRTFYGNDTGARPAFSHQISDYNIVYFGGGSTQISLIGEESNKLQQLCAVNNGSASSLVSVNNANEVTGTLNLTPSPTNLSVTTANAFFNTFLRSKQENNSTIRTDIYTLLANWNGNPA